MAPGESQGERLARIETKLEALGEQMERVLLHMSRLESHETRLTVAEGTLARWSNWGKLGITAIVGLIGDAIFFRR